jgi:hypothetical protein
VYSPTAVPKDRASAGDSGRAGSEAGGGAETAADSSPAGRVTDDTEYFQFADNTSGM